MYPNIARLESEMMTITHIAVLAYLTKLGLKKVTTVVNGKTMQVNIPVNDAVVTYTWEMKRCLRKS